MLTIEYNINRVRSARFILSSRVNICISLSSYNCMLWHVCIGYLMYRLSYTASPCIISHHIMLFYCWFNQSSTVGRSLRCCEQTARTSNMRRSRQLRRSRLRWSRHSGVRFCFILYSITYGAILIIPSRWGDIPFIFYCYSWVEFVPGSTATVKSDL